MKRAARKVAALAVLVLCGCAAGPLEADERARPALVARNPHGNYIVPGTLGDVVYRRVGGTELALDAYVQPGGDRRPGVIVVHGGGWTTGSRVSRVGQLLEMLTEAGFNWVSIDYRLAPEHRFPAALDDLRAALTFVRDHATELGVDPQRLALLGEDTGAHLALLLAAEHPPGLRAVVSLGGIFDLAPLVETDGLGERLEPLLGLDPSSPEARGRLVEASPIEQVTSGMAPALLVHGNADRDVPLSEAARFADALGEAGVESGLLEIAGGVHTAENWHPAQWGYKERVVDWLAETLEWVPTPVGPRADDHLTKDVVYGSFETAEGEKGELRMDAWIPTGEGPFVGVILVHGGGWEAGDKVTYLTPIMEPLSRAGLAWFSIDYRLTPRHRHPQQLDDLRRAIRYVRHHAARFRVDLERLAILGESAGGQMVTQLAIGPCPGDPDAADPVDREACTVAGVVSFYGVYDFLPMVENSPRRTLLTRLFGREVLDETGRALLRRYSPQHHAHRDMPPILLLNGTDEFLWEQGVAFAEKLAAVGADHELYRLEGAGHGMESWEGRPEWAGYKTRVVDWLKEKLGDR